MCLWAQRRHCYPWFFGSGCRPRCVSGRRRQKSSLWSSLSGLRHAVAWHDMDCYHMNVNQARKQQSTNHIRGENKTTLSILGRYGGWTKGSPGQMETSSVYPFFFFHTDNGFVVEIIHFARHCGRTERQYILIFLPRLYITVLFCRIYQFVKVRINQTQNEHIDCNNSFVHPLMHSWYTGLFDTKDL